MIKTPRVEVERSGPVARVWLSRSDVRNAMDPEMLAELTEAFRSLAAEGEIRVAVLGGRGRDFCAGADIGWMRKAGDLDALGRIRDARSLLATCRAVDEAPFVVISRVQGNCYGGGLGLVAASDIVVANEDARFCFAEARLGIIPAVVSTFVLPKIGLGQARRYFLTAEVFAPGAAKEIGLVHVAPLEPEFDAEIIRLTNEVLRCGPEAIKQAKAYLRSLERLSRPQKIARSARMLAEIRATPEAKEGLSAFLEKRRPAWNPASPS